MLNITAPEAATSARKLYGEETATRLFGEILEWHELASEELDLDTSCDINVELGVGGYGGALYNLDNNSLNLRVPLELDGKEAFPVPALMVHENAHRKRGEITAHCTNEHDTDRDFLFCIFANEGLATLAEAVILADGQAISFTEHEQQDRKFIDGLILDLLFYKKFKGKSIDTEVDRYLNGTPARLDSRCYKVGHFIVAKAFLLNNLTLKEALVMPDGFYREFTEDYL